MIPHPDSAFEYFLPCSNAFQDEESTRPFRIVAQRYLVNVRCAPPFPNTSIKHPTQHQHIHPRTPPIRPMVHQLIRLDPPRLRAPRLPLGPTGLHLRRLPPLRSDTLRIPQPPHPPTHPAPGIHAHAATLYNRELHHCGRHTRGLLVAAWNGGREAFRADGFGELQRDL